MKKHLTNIILIAYLSIFSMVAYADNIYCPDLAAGASPTGWRILAGDVNGCAQAVTCLEVCNADNAKATTCANNCEPQATACAQDCATCSSRCEGDLTCEKNCAKNAPACVNACTATKTECINKCPIISQCSDKCKSCNFEEALDMQPGVKCTYKNGSIVLYNSKLQMASGASGWESGSQGAMCKSSDIKQCPVCNPVSTGSDKCAA